MQEIQDTIKKTAGLIRKAHRNNPGPSFLVEYNELIQNMFPYGYQKFFQQIRAGDPVAIEFGLVFFSNQFNV